MIRRIVTLCAAGALWAAPAIAQETATYTYDVHGRLIEVERSTGAETTYAYDDGDSRTSRVTTGGASLLAAEDEAQADAAPADDPDDEDGDGMEAAPEA